MATLGFNHIYKMYSNGAKAVNDFTMEIDDKEFIVLVGPSGCGKSTTLRMIAGLEEITAGVLTIDGRIVNNVEPKDRDIAMVFQNYALYPHMTVFDNMAFGLKLHKTSDVKRDRDGNPVLNSEGQLVRIMRHYTKEEVREKVMAAAEILGIVDYLDRKPKAMSGGQRQRVALGRAIVRDPKVFLFDEPLSNLDAKLRASMRSEISKLHKRLKTTFVYVTHDQIETMTMGTRIVVMKDGFIQQIDTPTNLYRYPRNKFVAGFIGTPQMNFFEGTLKRTGDRVLVTIRTRASCISPKIPIPTSRLRAAAAATRRAKRSPTTSPSASSRRRRGRSRTAGSRRSAAAMSTSSSSTTPPKRCSPCTRAASCSTSPGGWKTICPTTSTSSRSSASRTSSPRW